MRKKLCVAGCSVSDYTNIEKTYGHILAEKLDYDYVHEGAGCGSNYRIWRKITLYIKNKQLTENDIIVVQYTEASRTEFWSSFGYDAPKSVNIVNAHGNMDLSYDEGYLIRYKQGAAQWQTNDPERSFFNDYETNFLSPRFAQEQFEYNNFNFIHMLKQLGMKVIFIQSTRIGPGHDYLIEPFLEYSIIDDTNRDFSNNLTLEDHCHFSQKGSFVLADKLYKHIYDLGWI